MDDSNDAAEPDAGHFDRFKWRTSSFSIAGECVGLAEVPGGIGMRNTKRPEAGTLFLSRSQIAALIENIKAGQFDHLL